MNDHGSFTSASLSDVLSHRHIWHLSYRHLMLNLACELHLVSQTASHH